MRREVLSRRDRISAEERITMSIAACEMAGSVIEFQPGDIVSGFLPIRSEIDLRPLMAEIQRRGVVLCLPVVLDRETIIFRELLRGEQLVDAGFGTIGPGPEARVVEPTIMFVPLAAFDNDGGRLGYGAGHYDRAIDKLIAKGPRPKLIGVAFGVQKVDRVPVEKHDQLLDMIITESGIVNVK